MREEKDGDIGRSIVAMHASARRVDSGGEATPTDLFMDLALGGDVPVAAQAGPAEYRIVALERGPASQRWRLGNQHRS